MRKGIDRIQINPKIMLGKPVVRGTRIPVYLILNLLAQGYTTKRLLKAYPALTREDIRAALEFAAKRFEKERLEKALVVLSEAGHRIVRV